MAPTSTIPELDNATIRVINILSRNPATKTPFTQLTKSHKNGAVEHIVTIVAKHYVPQLPERDFVVLLRNIARSIDEISALDVMPTPLKRKSRSYKAGLDGWIAEIEELRDKVKREQRIKISTYEMLELLRLALGLSIRKLCPVVSSLLHEFGMELKESNGPGAVRSRYDWFKREIRGRGPYPSVILEFFQEFLAEHPQ